MAGFLIGAGAVGAAVTLGWHTMSPVSQLYGRTFTGLAPGSLRLALTFDDGPNDPWTGRLLEVLARHEVRATFFLIGKYVAAHPGLARLVAEQHHELANHTFTHPNLIYSSASAVRGEIEDCRSAITDAAGTPAPWFRPPFGARRPTVLRAAAQAGLRTVMWRASAYDWKLPSPEAIVAKTASQIRGGEVILMHDGSHRAFGFDRSRTVTAADELLRRFQNDGYRFATIGEMLSSPTQRQSRKPEA